MEPIFFKSGDELRAWLEQHHDTAAELHVGYYKANAGETGISHNQAVDEALCFGWIDSVGKRIDDRRYTVRFTPRRSGSIWSAVNVKRMGELIADGRVQPAGLKAFEARDEKKANSYSYENKDRGLDERYEQELRSNSQAWDFFQAQAPSYQRAATHWVMSAKAEATRERRLAQLIETSANGERLRQFVSPSRRKES